MGAATSAFRPLAAGGAAGAEPERSFGSCHTYLRSLDAIEMEEEASRPAGRLASVEKQGKPWHIVTSVIG